MKCQPDWAGVLRVSTQQRTSSILPADTKVGWKWSSRDIQVGDVDSVYLAKDCLEPIKQIYTYCSKLRVRYGYIITEKELVFTRIRPFSLAGPLEVSGQHSRLRFVFSQFQETSHGYRFRIIEKIPSRTHLQRLSRKGPWSMRLYLGAAMQATILSLLNWLCDGFI